MNRCLLILTAAAVLSGCNSAGLSPREGTSQNISLYLYSLYDQPAAGAAPQQRPLVLPMRAAVAQIGEVAAPKGLLDSFRQQPGLFARVETIPGIPGDSLDDARHDSSRATDSFLAARHMDKMRRFARDMGMDYLILFGGTIDDGTRDSALSVADLTIVGAFIVPSRSVKGVARATGAVIDLQTDRVVLVSSAEAEDSKLASAVTENGERLQLMKDLREQVTAKLAAQLLTDLRQRQQSDQHASR